MHALGEACLAYWLNPARGFPDFQGTRTSAGVSIRIPDVLAELSPFSCELPDATLLGQKYCRVSSLVSLILSPTLQGSLCICEVLIVLCSSCMVDDMVLAGSVRSPFCSSPWHIMAGMVIIDQAQARAT